MINILVSIIVVIILKINLDLYDSSGELTI